MASPRDWVRMMKASIKRNAPKFNTDRMVQEYVERFYLPGLDASERLRADNLRRAKELAAFRSKLRNNWQAISVERVARWAATATRLLARPSPRGRTSSWAN
jgi:starch phosphorylase